MTRGYSLAALAALTFALAACDDGGDRMAANSKICATWKTTPAPTTAAVDPTAAQNGLAPGGMVGDAASPVDTCVKHWAYSLASSRDSAAMVADAAVAACSTALSNWNQGVIAQGGVGGAGMAPPDQSISTVTGQPTNAMAEHANFARAQALLYVVEARAGHCKPPAVNNGAPVGA